MRLVDRNQCPGGYKCCLNHRQSQPGNKHTLCICHDPHCTCHSQERYEQEKRKQQQEKE